MSKPKKKTQADGTRRSYFTFNPWEPIIIGIDTKDGPEHPLFDVVSNAHRAEDDEANIANVRTFGILKPILFERDGKRVIIVDGRTRVRWARCAAALQKDAGEEILVVPGLPKRGDGAMLYGISRAANTGRPQDSALEQARNAQRMLDMHKSEEETAIAFGIGPRQLRSWLQLLELDPKVQRALEAGKIGATAASALAKFSRPDQVNRLAELTAGGAKPTVRAAKNKIREADGKAPVETPSAKLKRMQLDEVELAVLGGLRDEVSGMAINPDRDFEAEHAVLDKVLGWFA